MVKLDPHRIAKAALAILDEEGLPAFSMRAVARALGVTPMALYHHVQDRAALAVLVLEVACQEQPLAPPADSWEEEVLVQAKWTRQAAISHPALFELRMKFRVWTPMFHDMADRWIRSWQRSGLDPERAVRAAMIGSGAVWGLVNDELYVRTRAYPYPELPGAELARTAAPDPAELFEFAVRAIVDGVHTRLMREQLGTAEAPIPAA